MVASLAAGQNRQKLTKRIVQAAQLGNERYTIWDTALAGFGVRIAPSGLRTFILRYRLPGNSNLKRYVTIGRFGPITVDQARERAKSILGGVAHGEDPAANLAERRAASTLQDVAVDFLDSHIVPKRKSKTAAHIGML